MEPVATVVEERAGIPGELERKVTGVVCEVKADACEVTTDAWEVTAVGWLVKTVVMPVSTPRELVRLMKEVKPLVCTIVLVQDSNDSKVETRFRRGDSQDVRR